MKWFDLRYEREDFWGFARLRRRVYLLNWVKLCDQSGWVLFAYEQASLSETLKERLRLSDKCGVFSRSASSGFFRRSIVLTDGPRFVAVASTSAVSLVVYLQG